MGLPILQELWDGVRWIIDFFVDKTPRPIQFLIFMLMLVVFTTLIPSFLHITGIHCNSDKEPMKLSPFNFFENIGYLYIDKDDLFNKSAYVPDKSSVVSACVWAVCNVSGEYYYAGSGCVNSTIEYKLQSVGDYFGCVLCNKTDIYVNMVSGGYDHLTYICEGDAVKIPFEDMNWWQQTFCSEDGDCMPPDHYYFDSTTGLYTCYDLDICGQNISNDSITYEVDQRLAQHGATPLYKDIPEQDYRRFVEVRCDADLKPNLTFYGIPIFDYKIWLFITIIYVLVMMYFMLKG